MDEKLIREGEELHERYMAALDAATPEQIAQANQVVSEHMSEYGYSFAEVLTKIVEG